MKRWSLFLAILIASGCTVTPLRPELPPTSLTLHNAEIVTDTVWSGSIVIDGQVKVFKGATLTIAPGTDIAFVRRDDDKDGLGDGTLIIEGSLQAIGTYAQPIRLRSAAANPQPGDWLEIRVDFSKESHLRYCDIRDSAHGLHAHFTKAIVEESHIHRNIDGCRLGQGNFIFRHNLIEANEGKGINFRNSTIEIVDNIIRHNSAGIFLFETDRTPVIVNNNLYANGDNLRLGDFFHRDLNLGSNWWGSADPAIVAASIYDANDDSTLGQVTVAIAPAWLAASGPHSPLHFRQIKEVATDGFVDAAPQPIGNDLLVASWDGTIRRLDPAGNLLWKTPLQEVIDAPLSVEGDRIFGQNWGREVFALRAADGARLWSFRYPPSPADDHRQGGLIQAGGRLLVPAWNGTLYALDPENGKVTWVFTGQAPLRATPLFTGERIILSGGDGTLSALALDGALLWQYPSPAPLLTPAFARNEKIIALDREGRVFALDRDGKRLWQRELGETCYYAAPIPGDDGLFVATAAGALWKLDPASGEVIWRVAGFGPIYSTPLLNGQFLIIGDNDGSLWLVDSISGKRVDQLKIGAAIQGGPTAFAGNIAVGSRDQHLHLLTIDTESPPHE